MNLKLKQWIDGYIGRFLATIHVFAVRFVGILLRRDHSLKNPPGSVLVIKMLGLGSVFMAIDSIYSVKKQYPNAKLILMCGKGVGDGIEPLNLFDEIWIHDDRNVFTMIFSGLKLLVKSWRLKNLWVMDLEVYSVLTTLFSAYTLGLNRFGFQLNKVHFRNYLNTHNVYFNQFIQVQENYKQLAYAMGVTSIKTFNIECKQPANKNTIAVNNTCSDLGGDLRKIPTHLLQHICNYILSNTEYNVALTGAPSDYQNNQMFINNYVGSNKHKLLNIAGTMSFKNYYDFLQTECAAMISIDSAPLHIAIKLGLPTLSFWGPINPEQRIDTNLPNLSFIYLKTHCSPCIHLSNVVPCGGNNICMKNITEQQVENAVSDLIARIK
jgi:ADP-heptose:LPS heptosyltransferase